MSEEAGQPHHQGMSMGTPATAGPAPGGCAGQVAIERRLQIELALGDDASTALPQSSFDLVHARLVLGNILAREEVVKEMVALCVGS